MVVMTDVPNRTLVLVRHAKAESGAQGGDHERVLTTRGVAAASEAGRWLAAVVPAPDAVWCSSATRAVQTWAAIAPSLQAPEPTVDDDLYRAGPREVLEHVEGIAAARTVVVGHNPTLEAVLAAVTGAPRGMRPGAVAVIDLAAGSLVEFWEPGSGVGSPG